MNKKMYIQPVVEATEVMSQSIICASVGTNDTNNVSSNIPGNDPIPVD